SFRISQNLLEALGGFSFDLLEQPLPKIGRAEDGSAILHLPAGAASCLSPRPRARGLSGDAYRLARACASFAVRALAQTASIEDVSICPWRVLAEIVAQSPEYFL